MRFGEVLERKRKKKGWSRPEVGRRTGVDHMAIYRIETGRQEGPLETLVLLCVALDVSLSVLPSCEPYASLVASKVRMEKEE